MEETFFISQLKMIWGHMVTFKKLQQGQGVDCTTGCPLDYNYFKSGFKGTIT